MAKLTIEQEFEITKMMSIAEKANKEQLLELLKTSWHSNFALLNQNKALLLEKIERDFNGI